jgi:hypothetical protein
MSLEARQQLVTSGRIIFQDEHNGTPKPTQRADLLNPDLTKSDLIGLLLYITHFYPIEITAVRSDHHIDGDGPGLHNPGGSAVDGWPLNSPTPGDYMDQNALGFQTFLAALRKGPGYYDTGLGGDAYTPANMKAAGTAAFEDNGLSHIHFGSENNE